MPFDKEYFKTIEERAKKSKIYKKYQLTGLMLAELLKDERHKSLYIKLAKERDNEKLIFLAKDIAERKKIKNKGAYFMKMLFTKNLDKK